MVYCKVKFIGSHTALNSHPHILDSINREIVAERERKRKRKEIKMVLISFMDRHLGIEKREDAKGMEEEHVSPWQERIRFFST